MPMVNLDDEQAHYDRMYRAKERDVRRQLIPPIIFFAAIIAVVLVSAVKHRMNVNSGEVEMTAHAMQVDYLTACLGNTIYENTDELDDSYGDYFYLGADYFEVDVEYQTELFDRAGVVVFTGDKRVESYVWVCDDADVTEEETASMADEMVTAYGDYEAGSDGVYYWYADEEGNLGDNTDAARVSCGLNEDGILVIRGEAD